MAVVRELVTRLAFQVDQSGVNKFNQTISAFRGGLEGIVSQAFSIGSQLTNFFTGVSQDALAVNDIARSAGIATERFVALRAAAGEFNIKPQAFEGAFVRLNNLLQQASFGFGELFTISQSTGIEFRDMNGNLVKTEQLFENILTYLGKVGDDFHRQRIAVNLFGQEVGPRLAEVALQGSDAISKAAVKYKEFGDQFVQNLPALREYDKNLNAFNQSLSQLGQNFVRNVLPLFTKAVDLIGKGIGRIRPNYFTTSSGRVISKDEYEAYQAEKAQSQQNLIENQDKNLGAVAAPKNNNVNLSSNNRIEITVPPGTTEQQVTNMAESMRAVLQADREELIRELNDNNPQVE